MIRPYQPNDRTRLRQIFQDTAFHGESFRRFLDDGEWLADLMTAYYTDVDSTHTWVVEEEGNVVGYLTGSPDTARYRRLWVRRVLPRVFVGFFSKCLWKYRRTWAFLWQSFKSGWSGESDYPSSDFVVYPAHFHINLDVRFRRHGWGRQLIERFCDQLRMAGVNGVHLRTASLEPTRPFFESCGFRVVRKSKMRLWVYLGEPEYYLITYGKILQEKNDAH
jgi:GNAT superfamily N-acetyltransferase